MQRANKCTRCGLITRFDNCTCGSGTRPVRQHRLARDLNVDVTLSLRFDGLRPYILVQKPSGQERVSLDQHDLIHV